MSGPRVLGEIPVANIRVSLASRNPHRDATECQESGVH
jgi:hypothetical protein